MKKSKQAWTNARRAKFERTIAARKIARKVFAKAGRKDAKNVAEVFNESPATTVRATDSGFVIDVEGAHQQLTILRHLLQTIANVAEDDYVTLTAQRGLRVIDGLFSRIR